MGHKTDTSGFRRSQGLGQHMVSEAACPVGTEAGGVAGGGGGGAGGERVGLQLKWRMEGQGRGGLSVTRVTFRNKSRREQSAQRTAG